MQTIVIHVLPNILRNRGNQAMKFSHLKEYNMKNISLEKQCTKCGEKTGPRPFSEELKWSISLNQQSEFYSVGFIASPSG